MNASIDSPWRQGALRPLAALVLAAWEDGGLSPQELMDIRSALERGPGLDDEQRATLRAFLDPDAPPSPQALHALERVVRELMDGLAAAQRHTFAELAAALSAEAHGDDAQAAGQGGDLNGHQRITLSFRKRFT